MSFSGNLTLYNVAAPCQLSSLPGPNAGAVVVQLPRERLVFCGDLLVADTHPALAGAHLGRWLESLAELQQMADDGLSLIPGRGPVDSPGALAKLVAFLSDLRDRISALGDDVLARATINDMAGDLLDCFPLDKLPREWVMAQLMLGIEHLHESRRMETVPRSEAAA
jgi:glyoxylase-like metal-dependent hydrolase (beta-lactamase superfamily II)